MFLIGLLIHFTFLYSIFDIYFKSPIVKNVEPYQPLHEAPADRFVLFVVDGLRAESFVNYTTMSYVRTVANSNGRWGISHTRVPTESRPGHVAIIAGFYEDPSAVAKGWKENPVDFDSVLNQTSYSWCWGTYDILEIFTKGTVDNHIFVDKLDPYQQSFSADKNTTLLDKWVFDRVKLFFKNAQNNKSLYERLHEKRIMFFLHLLGTDTSGHTHKPKTSNFLSTVKFVDEQIHEIETLIKEFYDNDDRTTFLVTSDHGMTDWGSHGTGDDHETETPYIIWGAGVKQVLTSEKIIDPESLDMSLEHKYNIQQADLTPIMSSFLGIPVPVNSIGQLRIEIINISESNEAKALYSNSRQLLSQYNKKRLDIEANVISMLYHPFEKFTNRKIEDTITFTEMLMKSEDYQQVIELSKEIMELSLAGLNYYHNYFQRPLLVTVTMSFIGWIFYLLRILVDQKNTIQSEIFTKNPDGKSSEDFAMINTLLKLICIGLCILISSLIYVQCLPLQYYIYFLMPVLLWFKALQPLNLWVLIAKRLLNKRKILKLSLQILCYVMGSLALALSFSYRWMLSLPLIGIASWPLISTVRKNLSKTMLIVWPIGCLLLSGFSFVPVVGKSVFIELVLAAGLIWTVILLFYLRSIHSTQFNKELWKREVVISIMQVIILLISLFIIYIQSKKFEHGEPVSQNLQTICWIISGILPVLPLFCTKRLISRLMAIHSSIIVFYLLLSISHEGLFMVTLIGNVTCWILIEHELNNVGNYQIQSILFDDCTTISKRNLIQFERNISHHDFRRAFIFTLYIILAYFGTGNIASLNSFEVRWVMCFTTSFKPYIITGLILMKTLCPFLIVGCSFTAIQHLTKAPSGYLNLIVLMYSNIMGMQLLYYVKNTGSWLDIGTSISKYVIVQLITVFIVLIHQVSKLLTDLDAFKLAMYVVKNGKKDV